MHVYIGEKVFFSTFRFRLLTRFYTHTRRGLSTSLSSPTMTQPPHLSSDVEERRAFERPLILEDPYPFYRSVTKDWLNLPSDRIPFGWTCDWIHWDELENCIVPDNLFDLSEYELLFNVQYQIPGHIRPILRINSLQDSSFIFESGGSFYFYDTPNEVLQRFDDTPSLDRCWTYGTSPSSLLNFSPLRKVSLIGKRRMRNRR